MNATTQTESTALQTIAPAESHHINANTMLMNPDMMSNAMRMAELMAGGKSTVPAHLQKNPADCMAVVLQSIQWGMLPNVVAQKTHLVNGTLGYEAQLVNAVVQASGSIQGRFHYEYRGNSPQLECRVGAVIRGENEITWGSWLNEAKVTTKNSPLWKVNPAQQLGYLQVKNWARLYCPGAILGVYTPDELEMIPRNMGQAVDITPAAPGILEAAQHAADEGVATYSAYWKSASPETRKSIGRTEHERLKTVAMDADKARTVTTEPTGPTVEQVIQAIAFAQTMDALFEAGNLIDQIIGIDDDRRKELDERFEERKFVLEAS